jgi:hypothetical protein
MVVYERKRDFLVAALALFRYSVSDAIVDVQGGIRYLLGGLAQETLREETRLRTPRWWARRRPAKKP